MPLYQMVCIAVHFPEYEHIKTLVRQSAKLIMNNGGVVRNIESWGTMQLPQRMKKKRTNAYEYVGDYWTLHCDTSPQTLRSLNNYMRRDPRVLRCTTLKLAERLEDVAQQARKAMLSPKPADLDFYRSITNR